MLLYTLNTTPIFVQYDEPTYLLIIFIIFFNAQFFTLPEFYGGDIVISLLFSDLKTEICVFPIPVKFNVS